MQKKYTLDMTPGIAGQIADLSTKTIDSFAAEEGLNPATPVARGTNPEKQVKAVAAGTAKDAIGVVIHEHKEPGDPYYAEGYAVGVMTKGRMWVPVTKAVTAGSAANYKIADKAFTDEAAATGIEAVGVKCVFLTSTTAAGLAQIQIG